MSSLDCVRIVESIFAVIWAVMSPAFIWIWLSFGGAWCPGALYGGARHMIVLTIGHHMRRTHSHTVPATIQAWFPGSDGAPSYIHPSPG